ncbi:hypothetical protein J2T15_004396 [Paenibacillus harenae]|uniref:Uncharacterized protein n=1 Tax=Paenibacillus harenae TaxID=306543 RepID=A0ABT9U9R9_PAEHA|nr:hypothetical protein [Paenibacillus harenae]
MGSAVRGSSYDDHSGAYRLYYFPEENRQRNYGRSSQVAEKPHAFVLGMNATHQAWARNILTRNKNSAFARKTSNSINGGFRVFNSVPPFKNDSGIEIPIYDEEMDAVRKDTNGKVPEDRLKVMARSRKINMSEKMKVKHPIVQYFYELRLSTL